jgi:hypothetical protein
MSASIQNPEAAQNAQAELLKQVRPTVVPREAASVKQRLEQKRDEQRRTVKVLGESVEFKPVGIGLQREAMKLRQRALNGDDDEAEVELVDLIFDTLEEHSVDPDMDAEWWGAFQFGTIREVFESLVLNDLSDEEREQIESFRGE